MKVVLLLGTLFFTSCSLNQLETKISSKKDDGLHSETLLRYSEDRIKALYNNKDPKISALAKCHNSNVSRGLEQLKSLYKDYKKDFDYWNKVGTCYYLDSNFPKAEFFFNHSLKVSKELGKKNPNSYNNLGVIALKSRHFDNAYQMFTTASKENSELLTPYFNMAQLNIQFGHIEKAERSLKVLHDSAKKDVDILAALGTVMMLKKQYQASANYFSKIDKHNQKRADISNHYAYSLYMLKKYKQADKVLKAQQVTTVRPVVEMRKRVSKLIKEALEKENRNKLIKNSKARG